MPTIIILLLPEMTVNEILSNTLKDISTHMETTEKYDNKDRWKYIPKMRFYPQRALNFPKVAFLDVLYYRKNSNHITRFSFVDV